MTEQYEDSVHFELREGLTERQRENALDHARRIIGVAAITPSGSNPLRYDVALEKGEDGLTSRFKAALTSHTLINVVPEIVKTESVPAEWKRLRAQHLQF